ncbi:unnamed protein product [Brassica napus]|uniref:(rape) hypothetical protein n=1 Tax=Brassica napus TaxID=3708 RepID=A0A816LK95_BRANA|nr:unnamed protein product [Brassica napus]
MLISSIDSTLRKRSRQERRDSSREKEASGFGFAVEVDPMGNESGYGSEPGYKGDVELGYGDEYDDEEEDVKLLFWGDEHFGSAVYVLVASGTLIGLAASNFAIISSDAPAFAVVLNFLLSLAVPLLLFRADLRRVVQSTGKLLLAFLIGSTKNQTCLFRIELKSCHWTEVKFWEWKNQVKFVCLCKVLRTLN